MKVLYIEEDTNYSEVFVKMEKDYLKERSVEVKNLYLKNLKINRFLFSNLVTLLVNVKLQIDIIILLLYSVNNSKRFRSNAHGIMLFISNMHLLKPYSNANVSHIRVHFFAKRTTFGLLTSRYLNIPFSVVAHAADIFDWDGSILYKMEKAEFIHAISNYNIGYLNAKSNFKYSQKISLIRNSFDMKTFNNELVKPAKGEIVFTIVARLIDKKGILEFLTIFKEYNKSFNAKSKLNIIGDGPLEATIKSYIIQNSLNNEVKLLGVLENAIVKKVLLKSSYLVLLSKNATNKDRDMDGLPTVFFEALNFGLPIISTEVSGIPELLMDGVNSILVDLQTKSIKNARLIHEKIGECDFEREKIKNDFQLFLLSRYGGKMFFEKLKMSK